MDAGLKACWDEDWIKAISVAKTPGARLDEIDAEGWCMMHHAVWQGRKDLLDSLLAAGANPGIQDKEGLTPGTLACSKGRWELAQSVATQSKGLDAQDVDGWAMLHYAAAHGKEALTSALLAQGASASLVDGESLTPALTACAKAQWGTALILANHGAALGAQDEDGWAIADYAADNGRKEILASVVRGGVQVDPSVLAEAGLAADGNAVGATPQAPSAAAASAPASAPRRLRG